MELIRMKYKYVFTDSITKEVISGLEDLYLDPLEHIKKDELIYVINEIYIIESTRYMTDIDNGVVITLVHVDRFDPDDVWKLVI